MNIKIKSSANIANILSNKIKIKKSRPISLKQWDLSTCSQCDLFAGENPYVVLWSVIGPD